MATVLRPIRFGIVCGCVAIAALTGCGNTGTPDATLTTSSSAHAAWTRPDNPPDPQTLLRAGDTAVAAVPDSTLVFIESQTDGVGTWKVQLVTADGTEQQVKIDSDGLTVLVGPTPTNDSVADKTQHRTLARAAKLNYQTAVTRVLDAVPNGCITVLKLADTNDVTVWAADVWDTLLVLHKVDINAVSGQLLQNTQV